MPAKIAITNLGPTEPLLLGLKDERPEHAADTFFRIARHAVVEMTKVPLGTAVGARELLVTGRFFLVKE